MSASLANVSAQRGASTTLLGAAFALLGLGSIMVYSTTAPLALGSFIPPHLARHGVGLLLGLTTAWLLSRVPLRVLRFAAPALFLATLVALAAVPFIGLRVNGAQRWLALPGVGVFQPGELAKFATVLWVAVLASYRGAPSADAEASKRGREESAARMTRQNVIFCLCAGAVPAGLLLLQPDFGNAALLLLLVMLVL
ncbi:MAG: FtsW/RodA/SpoVE family cell cycle protein, partial [Myxococcales bacterium]|nr:FtsW/RodA/SpoVE family cell cycle protein [Myxococcales bacterium]